MHPAIRPDLVAIAREFPDPPVSRFAPSPTGYLHLGHVVNAIYVWGVTRALGGRVLLRIEDHDRIRSRPEFEAALLEDLDWLGFTPDEGRQPLRRQRDEARYRRALARLRRTAEVYACECSRKVIGGERYGGRCRERRLEESADRGLRVHLTVGAERFDDLLLGAQSQVPAEQCGDLLLRDRDGQWTYQFAVVVDDLDQGVTLVVRGSDLLESTARQLRLGRMLGRQRPPRFLHHPLLFRSDGQKLSKSSFDTGVRELRQAGLRAEDVVGRAAAAIGLAAEPHPIHANDVPRLFELR